LAPAVGFAQKDAGASKQAEPASGYFATTLGRTDFDIVIVHYWSKGSLFRAETVISGHPIVTIVSGGMYYTYDGLTKEGYAVPRTKAALAGDSKRNRPFGNDRDDLLEAGGEKIRSESLNGIEVDVYRVTDDKGRRTLWSSAGSLGLPVRLETYHRQSGHTGKLDWITWIPGIQIKEAFFETSPDLKLVRFESYEAYITALQQGPVDPVPPLFHYLLHQP
jgi:hypothetical protein